MKKPKVSLSKKGAIINILWLLIENPTNLKYFRIQDIKELLIIEFGISLDRKTIQDYVNILIDLDLDIKIKHDYNKGYYINKRMISDNERGILFNAINNEKTIDELTMAHIYDFLTIDLSDSDKKKYSVIEAYNNNNKKLYNYNKHYNLVKLLELLQMAIDEKRRISFEYLTFNKTGKFKEKNIIYEITPVAIKYYNGMYYLYTKDKIFLNNFCGIKIKYMQNVKILDEKEEIKIVNIDCINELGILYDWTLEYISENFKKYKIVKDGNKTKAIITAPLDLFVDFCTRYSLFYEIYDSSIKKYIIDSYKKVLSTLESKDKIANVFKSSIVNYYYNNPIDSKSTYRSYMTGLKNELANTIKKNGYEYDFQTNLYKKDSFTLKYEIVEYCTIKNPINEKEVIINNNIEDYNKMLEAKRRLEDSNASFKYLILLHGMTSILEREKIIENFRNKEVMQEQFSPFVKSYFYCYDIFKI